MLISRNEALERLMEYRVVARRDPAVAHACAISVLLDIIDDTAIRFNFKVIGTDPLEILSPKLLGD